MDDFKVIDFSRQMVAHGGGGVTWYHDLEIIESRGTNLGFSIKSSGTKFGNNLANFAKMLPKFAQKFIILEKTQLCCS